MVCVSDIPLADDRKAHSSPFLFGLNSQWCNDVAACGTFTHAPQQFVIFASVFTVYLNHINHCSENVELVAYSYVCTYDVPQYGSNSKGGLDACIQRRFRSQPTMEELTYQSKRSGSASIGLEFAIAADQKQRGQKRTWSQPLPATGARDASQGHSIGHLLDTSCKSFDFRGFLVGGLALLSPETQAAIDHKPPLI